MAKKSLSKLLSVILTIAICATSIFGCVIAVNAAESATYTISSEDVGKETTEATVQLSFNAPQGMASVSFVVDNVGGWYSAVSVGFAGATDTNGTALSESDGFVITAEQIENASDYLVIVEHQASVNDARCAELVLNLTFTFAPLTETKKITISDIDASDIYGDPITFTGTDGELNTGCEHVYQVSGDPVYTDDANGYAVYNTAVCSICDEAKDGYQVVPVSDESLVNSVDPGTWSGSKQTERKVSLDNTSEPNSETNPYIINTTNLLYSLVRNELQDSDGNTLDTAGKYFRVADGIKAFYVNGTAEDHAKLTSAQAVKDYFEEKGGSTWWANSTFKGYFDGNGATVYGLYTPAASQAPFGLFHTVDGATIKNINVMNCYSDSTESGSFTGAIFGNGASDSTATTTISNCVVANNYLVTQHSTPQAGAIGGNALGNSLVISDCLVYGNYTNGSNGENKVIGAANGGITMSNTVCIGASPSTDSTITYTNVYTNQSFTADGVTQLTTAQMQGADALKNMTGLTDWVAATKDLQYPGPTKAYSIGAANATTDALKLHAANIGYNADGSFNLNFYYSPVDTTAQTYLYVPNFDGTTSDKFIKLTPQDIDPTEYTNVLPEGSKMFTIENLSARDIDAMWYPTVVTASADGGTVIYGATEQISVEDYATKVINGEAAYTNSTTDEQKQLDKDVAAALINYGYAAKDALAINSPTADEMGTTSTYTGTPDTSTLEGDGTEGKPYIIETADQFAAVARGYVETDGKYFKVKDGVKAFYINGGEKVANMTSAAEVKAYFTANPGKVWWIPETPASEYFKGYFDGNGVTVYGLYTGSVATNDAQDQAALFPKTGAGAVIKNITLKNSYIEGKITGGIVARGYDTDDTGYKLTLENIAVVNNHIYCTHTDSASWGGIVYAYTQNYSAEVTNCVVYGNDASYANFNKEMPVFSYSNASMLNKFYYIVSIGHSLEGNSWHTKAIDNGMYQWVYSDRIDENTNYNNGSYNIKYNITVLEPEQMLGSAAKANMPLLDWENTWIYGAPGEYPSLAKPVSSTTVEKNVVDTWLWTSGLASSEVNNGGTGSRYDDFFWKDQIDTAAGADNKVGKSAENPFIITTAEQLAAVCQGRICGTEEEITGAGFSVIAGEIKNGSAVMDTEGVYFAVDPSITAFYMSGGSNVANGEKLASLTNIVDVTAWFSDSTNLSTTAIWWSYKEFKGHFDGNGATVYGLYTPVGSQATFGLFPLVDGATIKNINVMNSYSDSTEGSSFTGAIFGNGENTSTLTTTISNCVVANNYLVTQNSNSQAGAIGGNALGNSLVISDCLVYGNYTSGSNGENKVIGAANGGITMSNTVCIGASPTTGSIITYNNVYTDQDVSLSGITVLESADLAKGSAAKTNMPNLAWDDIWFTGAIGEYPAFTKQGILPSSLQADYDTLVLDNYDEYGTTDPMFSMYASSLNLKANPYIAFTFAFGGDYKADRDKITVNFYKEDGTLITTTTVGQTDVDVDDDGYSDLNAGWTNNAGAGRYHLYRLTGIAVEDLCNGINVKVSYQGAEAIDFGAFSVEGFALEAYKANRILPCEYYATRYEAAKALLFYTQMVNERYGA